MPKVTVDGQSYTGVGTINVGGKSLAISQEYSGNKAISANGTGINVEGYSTVSVNVPASGITPSGTKTITSNATYDVTNYASVIVNVPSSGSDATVYTGAVGWGNRTPSTVNGKLRLQSPAAGEKGWLFESGASIYLDANFSEFGDATAADVAAGVTFTGADGLKVAGTKTSLKRAGTATVRTNCSVNLAFYDAYEFLNIAVPGGVASGEKVVSAAASSVAIDTGLAEIHGFSVTPASVPSGRATYGWSLPGFCTYRSSTGTGAGTAAVIASGTHYTISGGVITLKQASSYSIPAATYNWFAW